MTGSRVKERLEEPRYDEVPALPHLYFHFMGAVVFLRLKTKLNLDKNY